MIGWVWMMGCGSTTVAPHGVPDNAVHVQVHNGQVRVDGEAIGAVSDLLADPFAEAAAPVTQRLQPSNGRAGWLELDASTPFVGVRQLVASVQQAGVEPLVLSTVGQERAYAWEKPPRYGISGQCPEGPRAVHGAEPLITVSLQSGRDGTWLLASARFLVVVDHRGTRGPVDGLAPACLSLPSCSELYGDQPDLAAVCTAAANTPPVQRVALGGSNGCLVPIARTSEGLASWPAPLGQAVRDLQLARWPLVMVMPEAQTSAGALEAVFTGFARAEQPPPAVGAQLLIEGNDGPPMCQAPVRSAKALDEAMARWLGAIGAAK